MLNSKRLASLTALAFALSAFGGQPLKVGQQAPDFMLGDQDGKAVTLSSARGHKVVLVFYRGYW